MFLLLTLNGLMGFRIMLVKPVGKILIYSLSWPIIHALSELCNNGKSEHQTVHISCHLSDVMPDIIRYAPDIVVLDISLHDNCGVVNAIRLYHPYLPVIVTGNYFLFSDRVVAEYYGYIWLKLYDALLSGYPEFTLTDHLQAVCFAGTESGGSPQIGVIDRWEENASLLIIDLSAQLRRRFYHLAGSPRLCEVVFDWLIKGISSVQTGQCLERSSKVIYHYRRQAMRSLQIKYFNRDFIPSLTVGFKPGDKFQEDDYKIELYQSHRMTDKEMYS